MARKKGGLGRGIGALIPSLPESDAAGRSVEDAVNHTARPADVFFENTEQEALRSVPGLQLISVSPSEVTPNPRQPRREFDPQALDELVHSVREFGVMQPIVVRSKPSGGYELIMGERRLRASKLAELETIPAIVRQTDDEDMLRDALLENLHRSDLNPIEEASAYQQLLTDFGITQEQLAERIGRSRPQVSNMLRLLRLPETVQKQVAAGVLSMGQARTLVAVDPERVEPLARQIVSQGLSVREAEALAKEHVTPKPTRPRAGKVGAVLDDLAARLGDELDTSVHISLGRKKGKLTFDFATVADLNRLLQRLGQRGIDS
ncbi:MAG: ParB/RepB/Spo0J family partition protein [Microbacteriaceae bacterium]|jgi:ParB family chromosome partitioning protein|nr:ParB/RepB/Spo0J family partition protein [Microbacteriaceae bacterium]